MAPLHAGPVQAAMACAGPDVSAAFVQALRAHWKGRERCAVLSLHMAAEPLLSAIRRAWKSDARAPRQLTVATVVVPGSAQAAQPMSQADEGFHLQHLELQPGGRRLSWLLCVGSTATVLAGLHGRFDACVLGGDMAGAGAASHAAAPLHAQCRRLVRLLDDAAFVWTPSADPPLHAALASAGLRLEGGACANEQGAGDRQGAGGSPVAGTLAFIDSARRRPLPLCEPPPGQAIVIGAGLAGAAAARALALRGLQVTVLEAGSEVATQASGNEAGVWHDIEHRVAGTHGRWTRAAARMAHALYAAAVADGVPGSVAGFVRVHAGNGPPGDGLPDDSASPAAETAGRRMLSALQRRQAGLHPQWAAATWFRHGGWMSPRALVGWLLQHPGIVLRTGVTVHRLSRCGMQWHALAADGQAVASAPLLVVAAGTASARLVDGAASTVPGIGDACTVSESLSSRWQSTHIAGAICSMPAAGQLPWPVGGHGYALDDGAGRRVFGATHQGGDAARVDGAGSIRFNLQRLDALLADGGTDMTPSDGIASGPSALPRGLQVRVGVRDVAPDRLPVVGAVPVNAVDAMDAISGATSPAPRLQNVAVLPGLKVIGALGGRGLTWAPLCAELLAASVCAEPLPVPGALADAVSPARWQIRRARRGSAGASEDSAT